MRFYLDIAMTVIGLACLLGFIPKAAGSDIPIGMVELFIAGTDFLVARDMAQNLDRSSLSRKFSAALGVIMLALGLIGIPMLIII